MDNVALVDSFGALYPYHVRYLIRKYTNILGESIRVGVHFHNNQQQAFANSIAAIDEGVEFVDATIHGMGRGAGNCPLELLLFYLDNPKYDVRPILDLVRISELKDQLALGAINFLMQSRATTIFIQELVLKECLAKTDIR